MVINDTNSLVLKFKYFHWFDIITKFEECNLNSNYYIKFSSILSFFGAKLTNILVSGWWVITW